MVVVVDVGMWSHTCHMPHAHMHMRTCDTCTCHMHMAGEYSAARLRPSSGCSGAAVRMMGTGFVETSELTVCVRMRGVEKRIPAAFISETEVMDRGRGRVSRTGLGTVWGQALGSLSRSVLIALLACLRSALNPCLT